MFTLQLLVLFAIFSTIKSDYCVKELCPGNRTHIACNNDGNYGPKCPKWKELINIKEHKKLILQEHNSRRHRIANGDINDYKPAKRMGTMQYDDELASLAELNVKTCLTRSDECHNTKMFPRSGQNKGFRAYTGPAVIYSNADLIKLIINQWWVEYQECKMEFIAKIPRNVTGLAIYNFICMVLEDNTRVGCAGLRYRNLKTNVFLLACNYATDVIVDDMAYSVGKTALACKSGVNPSYKNLCSIHEAYA